MRSNRCAQPANRRFPLMGLLKAACLSLLPGFSSSQGLLPCQPETRVRTVANTNDAASLASLVQCSNGSFAVEWVGDVVVSQTIHITQGTLLNIIGASTDATADGNHTTQLFAVDGASSLHFTDMILANGGGAEFGGAILAREQSSISFGGNMTFASNTALNGGAIFADQSTTVFWDGEETIFRNNYASLHGGAIFAAGVSHISWDGLTVFANNSADGAGGAVCVFTSSQIYWSSNTTFVENNAIFGGAICAMGSTAVWHGDETTFSNNYASYSGGALAVQLSGSVYWHGQTVFSNNSADTGGGAIYAHSSSVIWAGELIMFSNNFAFQFGGALLAENSSAISWGGETVFVNNEGGITGGAIYAGISTNVSWKGETMFMNNKADATGGGLVIVFDSSVSWTGNTTFRNNSATAGGGLSLNHKSVGAWSGTTTFSRNSVTVHEGEIFLPGITFGGGLYMVDGCNVSWTGATTFTANIADKGGAIFADASTISWTGETVFADNIANQDGGAVYFGRNPNLLCRGTTTFSNNTATNGNGGALGIYGYECDDGPTVNISGDTTFTKNSAFANGGAIFSSANPRGQYFERVMFRANSANVGGAVATFGTGNGNELAELPTKFWRCQFIGNTAIETGGAVETAFGREEFVSTHFESNSADVGGALNLGGETAIRECSFVSNIAATSGLAVAAVGTLEINGSSFHGNAFFCEEGKFLDERPLEFSRTDRYDGVCQGCPPWHDCLSCTVSDTSFKPVCSIALEHTTAAGPGTTLETLSVHSGYWRATKESSTILACYNSGSCLGGQTGEESFCDDGYMGPYCSVCQSGYSSSLSTTCTRCSTTRRRWFLAIAVIAGVVAACAMAAFSAYLTSTNFEERENASMYHRMLRKAPLQAFKSVIVVWQILTQFASVANATYPGVYQIFLSSLDIINLDIGLVMSAGCLWSGIDFHDRLIADTVLPLTILGIMGMTYAIALRRHSTADDGVRDKIRNKHLSAVLFLLFFVYSSASTTVFRMFACDVLDDGEEYLRADYRILCTDAQHRTLQVYAAIMIAVYPVGTPLLFVVFLYSHRNVLSDPEADKATAQSISSLWAPYRPSCFYYEVIECGRRIMLTGVVVFIYPNDTAQIAITIINSFFFFVVSEALSPYTSASDTWLSRFGHVLIFFSMFDVLLLKVDASQESSESQRILAGVFVAGHVVMIVAAVAEAVGLCYASRLAGREVVEEPNPFLSGLRVRSTSVKNLLTLEKEKEKATLNL